MVYRVRHPSREGCRKTWSSIQGSKRGRQDGPRPYKVRGKTSHYFALLYKINKKQNSEVYSYINRGDFNFEVGLINRVVYAVMA